MDTGGSGKRGTPLPIGTVTLRVGYIALPTLLVLGALCLFDGLALTHALVIGLFVVITGAVGVYHHFATRQLIIAWLTARAATDRGDLRDNAIDQALDRRDSDLAARLAHSETLWRDQVAAFERAERLQRAVFDTVPEPLILLDARARVQAANRAAATRFGAGLIGVEIHQLLRQPAASDAIRRVLEHGGAEIVEIQVPGASGNVFALHVDSFRIDADSPPAALLLFTDLTDVKRAEQMRVDFIANASHELRTPLASLVGFVETLQGPARADDRARDQFMAIMQAQAARMSRLVEDLLSLSRIESSEHARPTDAVSLPAMLEAVRAGLAIEAQRLNIGLELAPVDQALPPALGDADQLAQVAQNLIENAIKYGRPDSLVTIRAFVPDQAPLAFPDPDRPMVAFAVTDQGQGIPKDVIPRLTERFYRVDAARSREMGGTGLGLAIVKHIVTRHRGALSIDSVAGAGSTFTVVLPAFEERVGGESAINFS